MRAKKSGRAAARARGGGSKAVVPSLKPRKGVYVYGEGPVGAEILKLERESVRVWKRVLRLKGYGLPNKDALDALTAAHQKLLDTIEHLKKVPKDWRPARGTLGATPLEEGMPVMLKESAAEQYKGLIDVKKPLKVLRVVEGKVFVTASGPKGIGETTLILARANIQLPE